MPDLSGAGESSASLAIPSPSIPTGDLPPIPDGISKPSLHQGVGILDGLNQLQGRTPGLGASAEEQNLPAMARNFDGSNDIATTARVHPDGLLDPKSDFSTAAHSTAPERYPVPEEPMGPPASLANSHQGPGHALSMAQDGPTKTVARATDPATPSANPGAASSLDPKTQSIVQNATQEKGVFGTLKQYILEHPEAVGLAVGLATASMGGGWKWSIAAGAAGWLGTNLFKNWSENSKKADALDKVASMHGVLTKK